MSNQEEWLKSAKRSQLLHTAGVRDALPTTAWRRGWHFCRLEAARTIHEHFHRFMNHNDPEEVTHDELNHLMRSCIRKLKELSYE